MSKVIYILNGSNLNLLGEREPEIYGYDTLADIERWCVERAKRFDFEIVFRQTNFEGEIVQFVHEARKKADAIIINPAGFTFFSVPLMDALKTFDGPKIEVHLKQRKLYEPIYHNSLISMASTAIIEGLRGFGYVLAVDAVADLLKNKQ